MSERTITEWREVSPTRESALIGIKRALVVFSISVLLCLLVPIGTWTVLLAVVAVFAIFSILFDAIRLARNSHLYERFEFDDRRFEIVYRSENYYVCNNKVIAYDALDRIEVSKGSLVFYERGNETYKELVPLEDFPISNLKELLSLISGRDVKVVVEEELEHLLPVKSPSGLLEDS